MPNAGKDATEAIWKPMLQVKFGAAAEKVPLAWIAGRLRQRVLSRRSGQEKLGYLEGSLQKLTDRLESSLIQQGVNIQVGKKVTAFRSLPDQSVQVDFADGSKVSGDRLVFTIPTTILSDLWKPHSTSFSLALGSIEYLGAICTVLSLPRPLSDSYWTNVADGDCDFGGIIEQTNLIPAREYGNQHLVYLSKYALPGERIWDYSNDELVDRQVRQLERIYGREIRSQVNQSWVFRSRTAAPVTDMGFRERIPGFLSPVPNVYLASMCHLYPEERSVNNSIRVAAELLRAMGEPDVADRVPQGVSEAGQVGHPEKTSTRLAA